MIKNIIFDWSGVINDSLDEFLVVVNKIFREFGAKEISLEEFKSTWEQPYMRFYNSYLPKLTVKEEQEAYKKYLLESAKSKPYPGIVELLKELKKVGIKMVVVSSDLPESLLPEIKSFGLKEIFIEVLTNVHDKSEVIDEVIKKNNFKMEETIFIGDSNHEIEEGQRAGVKTGAVTWGFSTKERLETLKPDFLINTIEELKALILMN